MFSPVQLILIKELNQGKLCQATTHAPNENAAILLSMKIVYAQGRVQKGGELWTYITRCHQKISKMYPKVKSLSAWRRPISAR